MPTILLEELYKLLSSVTALTQLNHTAPHLYIWDGAENIRLLLPCYPIKTTTIKHHILPEQVWDHTHSLLHLTNDP